jgi:hypothetical protein
MAVCIVDFTLKRSRSACLDSLTNQNDSEIRRRNHVMGSHACRDTLMGAGYGTSSEISSNH